MKRLILVAYFLEVGLLLVLVPWTAFWERNYFAVSSPLFHDFVRNHFVRGAVSGLGVVNLLMGFKDLAAILYARRGLGEPLAE
ncbi:MAG: hypothetical protein ND807_16545 [Vicinamibacterales bacterium]|nr:hypothetical protein [Vicinamibacterales bacterium]